MSKKIEKTIPFYSLFLTLTSALVVLGFSIFATNKGFNLTDEGFYLISGANPADATVFFTSFNQYLHGLMLIQNDIVFLRCMSLLIYWLALSLLAFAFQRIMPQDSNKSVFLLLLGSMITVWGLLFIFPLLPSYNTFTIVGCTIFYSILLLLLTSSTSTHTQVYSFSLGFLAIFVFFNKVSSGIPLIVLSLVGIGFLGAKDRKIPIKALVYLLLGMLTHLLIFFSLVQHPQDFLRMYQLGFQSTQIMDSNHSLALLKQNWNQFIDLLLFSLNRYQFVFYLTLAILVLHQTSFLKHAKSISISKVSLLSDLLYIGLLLLFFITSLDIDPHWSMERFLQIISFYFSAICVLLLLSLTNLRKMQIHVLFLLVTLLVLPFIVMVGSNNQLHMQLILSAFVWMPIIFYLANHNSKTIGVSFMPLTISGISLVSTYFAVFTIYYLPYGLYGNLAEQKYLTQVNDSHLYLDANSKYIIDNTREQLKKCGFKPNDYLVSLTDVPGLTYAVSARSPACPWYFGSYRGGDNLTRFCLDGFPEKSLPYVLLDSFQGQLPEYQESQLDSYFKNFSKYYLLCGEVKNINSAGGSCCKAPIHRIKIFKLIV